MKKIIYTSKAPSPIGPYSQAVQSNNSVYVSGQIAIEASTGQLITDNIKKETRQVLANIKAILDAAGLTMDHIIKSTIYIRDMNDFAEINEVYGSFFSDNFPARETIEVSRLPKDVNVEISVIAALY